MDPTLAARLRALTLVDIVPSVAARWAEAPALTAQAGEGEILVYGPIVNELDAAFARKFLGVEAVTGAGFRAALEESAGDVTVRINSPGGDVNQASVMLTALQERRSAGAAVDVVVDGMAASAASVLLTAARTVRIAALGVVMIHEMRTTHIAATGRELRKAADFLDEMNERFTALYAARMKRNDADVRALLADETFFSAEQAVEAGLADEVIAVKAPAATNTTDTAVTALFRRRNLRLAALADM